MAGPSGSTKVAFGSYFDPSCGGLLFSVAKATRAPVLCHPSVQQKE